MGYYNPLLQKLSSSYRLATYDKLNWLLPLESFDGAFMDLIQTLFSLKRKKCKPSREMLLYQAKNNYYKVYEFI